jgi:5'(3')-deoxyribonucleotidase
MKYLLLDVDGPVADFVGGVLKHTKKPVVFKEGEWDLMKMLDPEDRERLRGHYLKDTTFWENLPVVDGAIEGVGLLEIRYHIVWVTSPWFSCYGWESARRYWLNKHFHMDKKGHSYIPTSAKKLIRGDVMVDDKPENLNQWLLASKDHNRAMLFDTPYNRHCKDRFIARVTWKNLPEILLEEYLEDRS